MRIEESLLRPHANNLTLVRLVLASSVIYTHCYWALTGRMGEDDLSAFLGAPISVYAVDGFFSCAVFLFLRAFSDARAGVIFCLRGWRGPGLPWLCRWFCQIGRESCR